MKTKTLIFATLTLALTADSMAHNQRTVNPRSIEKSDRKLEKKNTRAIKKEARAAEIAGRKEYNSWTSEQKDESPWTTWYRKRKVAALLELSKIRKTLFKTAIFDNYITRPQTQEPCGKSDIYVRRYDGSCNDLNDTMAGAAETRMGRNVRREAAQQKPELLLTPDPRLISRELLTRDEFKPVPFLNLHAVSWIQFMTHDWFSHGENEEKDPVVLSLSSDDPIRQSGKGDYLIFQKTRKDPTRTAQDDVLGPTHLNETTHWWDASQVYGSDARTAASLRTFKDGLLRVNEKGQLPRHMGQEVTGFSRNWWLGLSTLHTLFLKEHNAIATHLKATYPHMQDEELYQKARLTLAALLAKIHTVEWTPAIIPNTTLYTAMNANWKGLANPTHKISPWFRLFNHDILFGLMSQKTKNSGVPFHLTEEFTSVYRMHSLLPDSVKVVSHKDETQVLQNYDLMELRESKAATIMNTYATHDIMFSFGRAHPGQLVLNNLPKSMQNIDVPFSGVLERGIIDIGAMDIFRDRERGVPRYNEFRRQIGLKPIKRFSDLASDPVKLAKLRAVYNITGDESKDIEYIDTVVGCLAEEVRPTNFGFGETAFQIFIAMASRRLMTDRFFTEDLRPEVYSQAALNWIDDNNMKTVLLRHYPELKDALYGVKNAFNPWNSSAPKAKVADAETK
jgi:hypothetical protein